MKSKVLAVLFALCLVSCGQSSPNGWPGGSYEAYRRLVDECIVKQGPGKLNVTDYCEALVRISSATPAASTTTPTTPEE